MVRHRQAFASLAILFAISAPVVLPFAGAQASPNKTQLAGENAAIPYAVSIVRDSNGPSLPSNPASTMAEKVGSFRARYISVRQLAAYAYNLQDARIVGGPTWLDSKHFDITAKSDGVDDAFPRTLSGDLQHKYALRQIQLLLEDRFHLRMHTEQKQMPVYALIVAKGGPKMRRSDDKSSPEQFGFHSGWLGGPGIRNLGGGRTFGIGVSMNKIVSYLASHSGGDLDRPLVDMTGLTGSYDFQLQWTPRIVSTSDETPSWPGLFTAIEEQLGLKLESRKSPVNVLVIDQVEMPTAN